ncbi:phosphoribosylformylglycinamidine cyclo-ligase [bacterium]|nr:phosphoribosylformylglycinamidine cyclo-ligase [bacterium]
MRYEDAGVNIAAGEEAVNRIKTLVRSTFSPRVLTDIGRFGGFFELDVSRYRKPVLVSSIDGVGTKLKVAMLMNKHDTIGEDLVHHCVNDIFVGGARPLFFLDYIGTGKLSPAVIEEIISGMVRGCRNSGCSLVGGEMAEMPGFYQGGEYDVAGCIVGVVEKDRIITGDLIRKKDVLVGLESSGLHTNGYSLARKLFFEKAGLNVSSRMDGLAGTVGEELLKVHRCYLNVVSPLLDQYPVAGLSHITGGGIAGNTRRIVPDGCRLKIDWTAWDPPAIFQIMQELGRVPVEDMRRTFNLGIGFVLVVPPDAADPLIRDLRQAGENPAVIGEIE